MASRCTRDGVGWILEKVLHGKGGQGLEQCVQGSAGITISGGVPKPVDVELGDMVGGERSGLRTGLGDLKGVFQPL